MVNAIGRTFLIAVIFILAAGQTLSAQTVTDRRTISVTGDAEVKVAPDQAMITLGIETSDKSVSEAKDKNDELITDLAKIARDFGINENDITTGHIYVNPYYEDNSKKAKNYSVRRKVTVTLNDVTKLDDFLTKLLDNGFDQLQDVQFYSTELKKHKDSARAMAIHAANEKAQAMASELGLKVGKAYNIEEKSSKTNAMYGNWYWNRYGNNSGPNPFNATRDIEPSEPIIYDSPTPLGKISISASVAVTFDLE